jgi:hypothetical protein
MVPPRNAPGSRTLRRSLAVTVAILALSPGLFGYGDPAEARTPPSEYLVKAAFIYNIAQFIEWPAEAFSRQDAPIVIGIVGKDPFGEAIDKTLADKKARGRPFVVRRLASDPSVRECHILFVSSSESGTLEMLKEYIKSAPVLTVGDTEGFAADGGVVNLVLNNNKVGLEINVAAAKLARLNISSKLLSLAKIVQ